MRILDEADTQSRRYRCRDFGEAVDRRYESLKGYDGVIVLRLTAPLSAAALDEVVAGICRLIDARYVDSRAGCALV